MKPYIRWMMRGDMPEVMEMEQMVESLQEPWTDEYFREYLSRRDGIVIEDEKYKILGFMVYEFSKTEFILNKLIVHPDYRLQGLGRTLIDKLDKLSENTQIVIEVHESNLDGHLFLKSVGFEAVSISRGAFGNEDGFKFIRNSSTMSRTSSI